MTRDLTTLGFWLRMRQATTNHGDQTTVRSDNYRLPAVTTNPGVIYARRCCNRRLQPLKEPGFHLRDTRRSVPVRRRYPDYMARAAATELARMRGGCSSMSRAFRITSGQLANDEGCLRLRVRIRHPGPWLRRSLGRGKAA